MRGRMSIMDKNHREILSKYNRQVARYTSYPPATQFKPIADLQTYKYWLEQSAHDISLYIHIPFCMRLCHYCGCHMRVVNTYKPVEQYLEALKQEIVNIKQHLHSSSRISHLHFGGGSPTMLKAPDFQGLMQAVYKNFEISGNAEISIEADPRNLNEAKIATYAKNGVNRLSLGVQDFNEEVLSLINRPQPFHLTYRAIEMAREYGIGNINFDLMYGLPGQTPETILETMDLALMLEPSRIAFFGYAHVPWLKRHQNLMPAEKIPGPQERYEMQEQGASRIIAAGYEPVGIDHFALPEDSMYQALRGGKLHRNFQGYTTDHARTLIGLGASAISSFDEGYIQNATDIKDYMQLVQKGDLAARKQLFLSPEDYPVKAIIESLMCYLEVDLVQIRKQFSLAEGCFDFAQEKLKALADDRIISVINERIVINPEFRVLARIVCELFDHHSSSCFPALQTPRRHAQAI
jgi:oxygen-independent coproporphyrinogen-3 oxidase